VAPSLDPKDEERFWEGVRFSEEFFMGDSKVHRALDHLVRALGEADIPYAIIGALALNEYGYRRVTVDVNVLLTRDGLAAFKQRYLGRGYVERFPGSKSVRDTRHGVNIDVLISGDYPGDGKPKPIAFPDPIGAEHTTRMRLLPMAKVIELKLASGISAPHRLKDLADVMELIKHVKPPRQLGDQLDPYVRAKYFELWDIAQTPDPISDG
jgi:hypothetical protein